jgi:hypothetical protein
MTARRPATLAALLVAVVLAIVTVRQLQTGRVELDLADAAAQKSDWPLSIAHARSAAESIAPGSPWPERGWSRLEAMGHDAEARGDDETALLAYGAMRSAALATRGPFSSGSRRRAQAEDGLARVAASVRSGRGIGSGSASAQTDPRAAAEGMLDALRESEPPATALLSAMALSALAMIGGLGRLAWLGQEAARARVAQAVAALGLLTYAAVALTH